MNLEPKEKQPGDAPVLSSKNMALWRTSAEAKSDLSGEMSLDGAKVRVLAFIRQNPETKKKFLALVRVDGTGAEAKFTELGVANPVNTVSGEPVAADRVRRLIVTVDAGDGHDESFSVFAQPAMSEELFREMGFEGPLTVRQPKPKEEAAQKAKPAASAPSM